MSKEANDPSLGYFREERPDVGVQNVVYLLARDPGDQRIQRIVLTALWPEPIRKAGGANLPPNIAPTTIAVALLDDFILQSDDCKWPFAAISSEYSSAGTAVPDTFPCEPANGESSIL